MSQNKAERIQEKSPPLYVRNQWWKTGDVEHCDGLVTVGHLSL